MQTKEKKNIIFIRLFPDEDVNTMIQEACKKHNVQSAVVLAAIGQLKKAEIGYFKEKGDYSPETFEKNLEILSLTGNVTKDEDNYIPHLHIVLGNEKKNALGGHFINGQVSVTAEIVLLKTSVSFKRTYNESTGLKDMNLE